MVDQASQRILPFLEFLSQNDIKDIAFLLAAEPTAQQNLEIKSANQLLAAVQIWYGATAAPSALYQAMVAANMPMLAVCILNTLPSVASSPECIKPLWKLLFNIAIQFPDADVPTLCKVLNINLTMPASQFDALDLMMHLVQIRMVTDTDISQLTRLIDMSPHVSSLIAEYSQRFPNSLRPAAPVPLAAAAAAPSSAALPSQSAGDVATNELQMESYPIKDPVCVIINVNRVHNRPVRIGSERDVGRLEELFKRRFGYHLFKKIDPRRDEVTEMLQILKIMLQSNKKFDCLVAFVMSHGNNDRIEFADGQQLHYWKDIVLPFLDGCMRGRPKIFFFQCCRGELLQQAEVSFELEPQAVQFDGPSVLEGAVSMLDNRDLYVCHSTFEGFAAIREENSGSWFIQTMCDVLERPVRMDLECLRMTVTRELQNRQARINHDVVTQTPVVEKNTLTKHVYLQRENVL